MLRTFTTDLEVVRVPEPAPRQLCLFPAGEGTQNISGLKKKTVGTNLQNLVPSAPVDIQLLASMGSLLCQQGEPSIKITVSKFKGVKCHQGGRNQVLENSEQGKSQLRVPARETWGVGAIVDLVGCCQEAQHLFATLPSVAQ